MTTIQTIAGAVGAVAILDGETGLPISSSSPLPTQDADSDLTPQTKTLQAVSTTPLRVCGATGWTLTSPNSAVRRQISVTNQDTANNAYFAVIPSGTAATGEVSATDYEFVLGPGASMVRYPVKAGFDMIVVRSAGTGNVRGQEFI